MKKSTAAEDDAKIDDEMTDDENDATNAIDGSMMNDVENSRKKNCRNYLNDELDKNKSNSKICELKNVNNRVNEFNSSNIFK